MPDHDVAVAVGDIVDQVGHVLGKASRSMRHEHLGDLRALHARVEGSAHGCFREAVDAGR